MAITPIWVLGWETNSLLEGNATDNTGLPVVSSTKAKTGTYSLRFSASGATASYGRTVNNLTELQAAASFNHDGIIGSTANAAFFRLVAVDGRAFVVRWSNTGQLELRINTTTHDSLAVTASGISPTDQWHDLSVAVKIDASAGYFDFYGPGGTRLLHYAGNTGSSPVAAVLFGGGANGWNNYLYVDDCRCLDATGEGSRPASTRRYLWSPVDGDGQVSQWTGSDGNSTDNYQLVDDATPDGDTTFVKATSAGLVDQYMHAGVTIPTDWVPTRVWPTVIGLKTDAGVDTTIQLGLWKDSEDDDSAEVTLPSAYGLAQAYFETLPDASDMNETNINATEIRLVSSGDYS